MCIIHTYIHTYIQTHSARTCVGSQNHAIVYYFCYSSLDLGLPLWIGGAPEIEGLSEGTGINSCISNFTINNQLLDLEDYVDELNSARGCEQVGVVTVANIYCCVTIISLMVAVLTHVWRACVQWNGRGTNAMVGVDF